MLTYISKCLNLRICNIRDIYLLVSTEKSLYKWNKLFHGIHGNKLEVKLQYCVCTDSSLGTSSRVETVSSILVLTVYTNAIMSVSNLTKLRDLFRFSRKALTK